MTAGAPSPTQSGNSQSCEGTTRPRELNTVYTTSTSTITRGTSANDSAFHFPIMPSVESAGTLETLNKSSSSKHLPPNDTSQFCLAKRYGRALGTVQDLVGCGSTPSAPKESQPGRVTRFVKENRLPIQLSTAFINGIEDSNREICRHSSMPMIICYISGAVVVVVVHNARSRSLKLQSFPLPATPPLKCRCAIVSPSL